MADRMVFTRKYADGTVEEKVFNSKEEWEAFKAEMEAEKARKEAERQRIEAEGKAEANRIISASLTDNILREKGIQATLDLAKSGNSKVVVVGSAKDGLPLILGK